MDGVSVNDSRVDESDFTRRPDDPLTQLIRQDLDPMSKDELAERIITLEAEIARCKARLDFASSHKNAAEALFGKPK